MDNYLIINKKQLPLTGCIKAKISKKANEKDKYKLRILKDSIFFTYDISKKHQIYPLQLGVGKYIVCLYKNITGTKYHLQQKKQIILKQSKYDLNPNIYVNYSNLKNIFILAKQLNTQKKDITIQNIKKYISKNYKYNRTKAIQTKLKTNNFPNIQQCFDMKMGICQDLAALTTALFRINNIPTKFVIGYVENQYHAWTEYYNEQNQKWILFDPTKAISNVKIDIKNYQTERWY